MNDFLLVTEKPESNERWYEHAGCVSSTSSALWMVPMDDVPCPHEAECADCAQTLPVYKLVPEPVKRAEREVAISDEAFDHAANLAGALRVLMPILDDAYGGSMHVGRDALTRYEESLKKPLPVA